MLLSMLLVLAAVYSNKHEAGFASSFFSNFKSYEPYKLISLSSGMEESIVHAVKRAKPSVVRINASVEREGEGRGIGSGVIFRKDGYILTNVHVIKGSRVIYVTLSDGRRFNASVVNLSNDYDLALLKIAADTLTPASFGDSDKLQLGQIAIAIGNPHKFGWTVTVGVVSALNREVQAAGILYHNLIQTDAAINPGNSGGALVDTSGRVIGINTLVYTGNSTSIAQGLGFSIPSNTVRKVAEQLLSTKKGKVRKPWVGISMQDVTPDMAEQWGFPVKRGVLVADVISGSPAAAAGIIPGDIIVEIDGINISSAAEFKSIVNSKTPGSDVIVVLWRQNEKRQVRLRLLELSQ